MKEPVRGEIAPKKISHIQFGLLSATEMERLSEFQVFRSDLFTMPQRTPAPNSPLDPRLGMCVCVCVFMYVRRECVGNAGVRVCSSFPVAFSISLSLSLSHTHTPF